MFHDRQSDVQEFEVFCHHIVSEDIGEYNRPIVDYLKSCWPLTSSEFDCLALSTYSHNLSFTVIIQRR